MAYARNMTNVHLPAWKHFNQVVAKTTAVGIWHETYVVPAGHHESSYVGMPRSGLAAATSTRPVGSGQESAAERLRLSQPATPAA
jgi:hypothetical protein